MDYNYELEQKTLLVTEAFRQHGIDLSNAVAQIETDGLEYAYRNKMEYSLWWDKDSEKIELAFHRRGSHQKVPVVSSSIERPEILAEAKRIIDELNARGEPARKYQSLTVRCNQAGQVSAALFENGRPHPKMKPLTDKLLGQEFQYSPNGFFQINLPVYEQVLREIKNFIKFCDAEKVVDFYSGVGTIGLSVAADKKLVLVETDASVFRELVKNVPVNSPNITPVCSKSEDALDYIENDAVIIVDPPRAGLHPDVVEKLYKVFPPVIIYLSCNPTTQARDIAPLLEKYEIVKIQTYNFFPRTPHIENLVILRRCHHP
jgi:23S rRNA (uracil1939-C5)-methyltransferase